jgi:hypothetical protein
VHVPGKRGYRWMYVSVAVDCYSYDLLHIAIAPQTGTALRSPQGLSKVILIVRRLRRLRR